MASTQEAAVAAAVEAFRKAVIAADGAALDRLTMPELTYGHGTGRVENKAQFVDSITSGKAGYATLDLSQQSVTVSDRTAIVRHHFVGVRRNGGVTLTLEILQVWVQQPDQQWKLLARQAIKLVD